MTPARPDLDAIRQRHRLATDDVRRAEVVLALDDIPALVAWIEHLEAEIAALEVRLPDVISVKRRPR